MRRTGLISVLLALVLAPSAHAAEGDWTDLAWAEWRGAPLAYVSSFQPGTPPTICRGDFWADLIGTNAGDEIEASEKPERLWGRAGTDYLYGSDSRASCLFGGRDPDIMDVWLGGGAAWGEHGSDQLAGGPLDDVLDGGDGGDEITGNGGADAIHAGEGADGVDAGEGDDRVYTLDGRGEVVQCGAGDDEIVADFADVLLSCEYPWREGRGAPRVVPSPRAAQADDVVRFALEVPESAGGRAYRVLQVGGCTGGRAVELVSFPRSGERVRAGQRVRVGLRPPAGEWCQGRVRTAIVLYRPCRSGRGCATAPPPEVIARLDFSAG